MVTKKSKRFIKALQSFCIVDNIVIEKKIKERRVMNKRRGMELIGIGCVSILLAGTGFFFLQQKQNAVQVEAFDEEAALPEENQLILDIYTEEDFAAFADSVNQGENYDGEYVNLHVDLDYAKLPESLMVGQEEDSAFQFAGVFDGNGHVIENLKIEAEKKAGLFRILRGTVCNLYMKSGTVSGSAAGGVAGEVEDSAFIMNCGSDVEICGETADGVSGYVEGTVLNCSSNRLPMDADTLNQGAWILNGIRGSEQMDGWYCWAEKDGKAVLTQDEATVPEVITAKIGTGEDAITVNAYYSLTEESWCLAVPAGAEAKKMKVTVSYSDGTAEVLHWKKGEIISAEKNGVSAAIRVLETGTMPALMLSSGIDHALTYVREVKTHKVNVSGTLLEQDGTKTVLPDAAFRGHGNDSWSALKKSYNLIFAEETDLCGLGAARNYALLAGYRDNSLMSYKATYDLAQAVGMDYVPETCFVQLYVDGEYMGIYFLAGKIEIGENRIDLKNMAEETKNLNQKPLKEYEVQKSEGRTWYDLDRTPGDVTGGWILEYDERDYDPDKARFISNHDLSIVLRSMPYASRKQVDYIAEYWQDFEDALYAEDGCNEKGKHYMEYIDAESFAEQWILQELNTESSLTSSVYFYKDSDEEGDGKLHGLYLWDMEHSLTRGGMVHASWIASKCKPDEFWAQFYRHKDFSKLVNEVWNTRFLPAIQASLQDGTGKQEPGLCALSWYEEQYRQDDELNRSLWEQSSMEEKTEKIRYIYTERSAFLTKAFALWEKDYIGYDEEEDGLYGITEDLERIPVTWEGEVGTE